MKLFVYLNHLVPLECTFHHHCFLLDMPMNFWMTIMVTLSILLHQISEDSITSTVSNNKYSTQFYITCYRYLTFSPTNLSAYSFSSPTRLILQYCLLLEYRMYSSRGEGYIMSIASLIVNNNYCIMHKPSQSSFNYMNVSCHVIMIVSCGKFQESDWSEKQCWQEIHTFMSAWPHYTSSIISLFTY